MFSAISIRMEKYLTKKQKNKAETRTEILFEEYLVLPEISQTQLGGAKSGCHHSTSLHSTPRQSKNCYSR